MRVLRSVVKSPHLSFNELIDILSKGIVGDIVLLARQVKVVRLQWLNGLRLLNATILPVIFYQTWQNMEPRDE